MNKKVFGDSILSQRNGEYQRYYLLTRNQPFDLHCNALQGKNGWKLIYMY